MFAATRRALARCTESLIVISLVAIAWPEPAAAQQAADASDADVEPIMQIIVTARRREESLQDTPVAITALSGDELERQQVDRYHRSRQDRAQPAVSLLRNAHRQQFGRTGLHPRHRTDRRHAGS